MKILLVDDDFFFQKALSFSLLTQGHEVLFAIDGQKALAILELHTDIDVVISDMEMPVLNGAEFIAMLKQQCGERLPVIVLVSGLEKAVVHIQAPEIIYDYYFKKPLDVNQFDNVLEEIEEKLVRN